MFVDINTLWYAIYSQVVNATSLPGLENALNHALMV